MNILDIFTVLITVSLIYILWTACVSAWTAGRRKKPTIIGLGILVLALIVALNIAHFLGLIPGRAEINEARANTEAIAELTTIKRRANEILDKSEQFDKAAAENAAIRKKLDEIDVRLISTLPHIGKSMTNLLTRIEQLEATAVRPNLASIPIIGDQPAVINPTPQAPPAPQVQSNPQLQQLEATWAARIAQMERAKKASGGAQRAAIRAEQTAIAALEAGRKNTGRIEQLEQRANNMGDKLDRIILLLESTNAIPVPAAYLDPVPAPAPPPTYVAPAAPAPPAPVASQEVAFVVTNMFLVKTYTLGFIPKRDGITIIYMVVGKIRPNDDMATARRIVEAASLRFHEKHGSGYAKKDPTLKATHDSFVLDFSKVLADVRKGNPGWEHLKVEPSYTVSTLKVLVTAAASGSAPSAH